MEHMLCSRLDLLERRSHLLSKDRVGQTQLKSEQTASGMRTQGAGERSSSQGITGGKVPEYSWETEEGQGLMPQTSLSSAPTPKKQHSGFGILMKDSFEEGDSCLH